MPYIEYISPFLCTHTQTSCLDTPGVTDSKAISLSLNIKSSPSVVRISQGLVHTSTLAAHVWLTSFLTSQEASPERSGDSQGLEQCDTDPVPLLLNHYILCNDTLEDLHIGQVS